MFLAIQEKAQQAATTLNTDNLLSWKDKILEKIPDIAMTYGPKLIGAILIVWIGLKVINKIEKMIALAFEKAGLNESIRPFLSSLIIVSLKVFLLLSAAGMAGIELNSLAAVLAGAVFAIGMALQGSLGNLAAGIMILIFKPYKVGDIVNLKGEVGKIVEVQIFNTVVKTFDNKLSIIPNGLAIGDIIINMSEKDYVRVDLNVFMPYEEDFDYVEKIIKNALKVTPKVLEDPAPFVGIEAWESHSILLSVRPHCHIEDYWDVYYDSYRNVTKAMADNNIKVAYSEGVELGKIGK
jgi:small conductance mechanosensitive channel